jgi:hypothetical protein
MGILKNIAVTAVKVAFAPVHVPMKILDKIGRAKIVPDLDPHYHDSGVEDRADDNTNGNS